MFLLRSHLKNQTCNMTPNMFMKRLDATALKGDANLLKVSQVSLS